MGFLFGGSGGTSSNQSSSGSSSTTTSTDYTPQYDAYVNNILSKAQALGNTPFPAYDISKLFAPFQPAQNQAFTEVGANQNVYQPYTSAASGVLSNVSGLNPYTQGIPFINQAATIPNAYAAGAPYVQAGSQTWNPTTQANYMNPYLSGALSYANQLTAQNFNEQVLPSIQNAATAGGGQLGNARYMEFLNRATRDYSNAVLGQNNTAASGNYWNAAGQFNADQARLQQAGTNLGALSTSGIGAQGALGTQAAGITSGAVQTGTGLAGAYSNLGGALSNLGLTNANALLQVGNQQQQQAQNPLTAQYNQFQQAAQWPFQLVNFMNSAQRGLQIPSTTSSQSNYNQNTTGYGSSGSSPSILGGVLGGIGAAASLGSGLGGLSGAGGLFSGTSLLGAQGPIFGASLYNAGNWPTQAPNYGGNPVYSIYRRGGSVGGRGYLRGGRVARRAMGGPSFGPIVQPRGVTPWERYQKRDGATRKFAEGGETPDMLELPFLLNPGVFDVSTTRDPAARGRLRDWAHENTSDYMRVNPQPWERWHKRGGAIRGFSAGGLAPVVRGVNRDMMPALRAIHGKQGAPGIQPQPAMGGSAGLGFLNNMG